MKNEIIINRYELADAVDKILTEKFSNKRKNFNTCYWYYPEIKLEKEIALDNGRKFYLYEFKYTDKKRIIIFNNDINTLRNYFAYKVIAENTKKGNEVFEYSKSTCIALAKELVLSYHNDEKKTEIISKLNNPNSKISQELAKIKHISVEPEVLFKVVDDHKKIRKEFLKDNYLQYLDLMLIDFTNVDIQGVDFRNTNANINPQTVYNKDISGCNFDGIDLGISTNFTGVNMQNTSFKYINGVGTFIPKNQKKDRKRTKPKTSFYYLTYK